MLDEIHLIFCLSVSDTARLVELYEPKCLNENIKVNVSPGCKSRSE